MILLFETDSGNEANRIIAALNAAGIATFLGGQNVHSLRGMLVPNPLGVYVMDSKNVKEAHEILNKVLSE